MTSMPRRRGFTLIELMIVMAITVILLGAVFMVNFRITGLWASERSRSELQQNFRFATDDITTKVRQAIQIIEPSAANSASENVMSDHLVFDYVPDPMVPTARVRVTYSCSAGKPYYINESIQGLVQSGSDWVTTGVPTDRAITESIHSLAAVHFVRTGSVVIVMLVAQYDLLGSVQTISYTTETYVRTLKLVDIP